MGQKDPVIINIISGKGGTGKTLICASLAMYLSRSLMEKQEEEMRLNRESNQNWNPSPETLVIDLDLFVRGLTGLLTYQIAKKEDRRKAVIGKNGQLTVWEFFQKHNAENGDNWRNIPLSISRFETYAGSFDAIPATPRISALLKDMNSTIPPDYDKAYVILKDLLDKAKESGQYRYIFLDNRAGYDGFVCAAYSLSDFSVCVTDGDDVCNIVTDTLIYNLYDNWPKYHPDELREGKTAPPIYRIQNRSTGDISKETGHISERGFVGRLPFDRDIMEYFGERGFWRALDMSNFLSALIYVWNGIADIELYLDRIEIKGQREKPIPLRDPLMNALNIFTSSFRTVFLTGLFCISASILFLFSIVFFHGGDWTPFAVISALTGAVGIGLVIATLLFGKNRKRDL